MSVKIKQIDDVRVMEIHGKLMGGPETDECHEKLKQVLAEGNRKIVADLSHVKWVNSRGLGMLMACYTSTRNAEGDFKIAGASQKTESLFMMTKLITIFENHGRVEDAVASFQTGTSGRVQ